MRKKIPLYTLHLENLFKKNLYYFLYSKHAK